MTPNTEASDARHDGEQAVLDEFREVLADGGEPTLDGYTERQRDVYDGLLARFEATGEPVSPPEVIDETGVSDSHARRTLASLVESGHVEKVAESSGRSPATFAPAGEFTSTPLDDYTSKQRAILDALGDVFEGEAVTAARVGEGLDVSTRYVRDTLASAVEDGLAERVVVGRGREPDEYVPTDSVAEDAPAPVESGPVVDEADESDDGEDGDSEPQTARERDGVPKRAYVSIKEIDGAHYAYWQWRDGDKIKSQYRGPATDDEVRSRRD